MTDAKITALTAAASASDTDLVPFVESPGVSPVTKKITVANLFAGRAGIVTDTTWDAKGDLVAGTGDNTAAKVSVGTNAQKMIADSAAAAGVKWIDDDFGWNIVLGDGIGVISTGVKGYIEVPYNCTIEAVRLFADVAGACVVDIWQDTYANFPPTDADSITAGGTPPTIAATNQKSEDTTMASWATTALVKNKVLAFNVDSCVTIKQVTLSITGKRTATA